jgi:hypothetical protein
MTTARDKIAEILSEAMHTDSESFFCIDEAADAILAALPDMIAPLDFQDMGRGYWGGKPHGYQVAWCSFTDYRVRLNGRVICRKINGRQKAIDWANAHHRALIMAAFTPPTGEKP